MNAVLLVFPIDYSSLELRLGPAGTVPTREVDRRVEQWYVVLNQWSAWFPKRDTAEGVPTLRSVPGDPESHFPFCLPRPQNS